MKFKSIAILVFCIFSSSLQSMDNGFGNDSEDNLLFGYMPLPEDVFSHQTPLVEPVLNSPSPGLPESESQHDDGHATTTVNPNDLHPTIDAAILNTTTIHTNNLHPTTPATSEDGCNIIYVTPESVKRFVCNVCRNKDYDAIEPLLEHVLDNHPQNKVCTTCGYSFPSTSRLNHHINISHRGMRYQCSDCSIEYKSKGSLLRHIEKCSSSEPSSIKITIPLPILPPIEELLHQPPISNTDLTLPTIQNIKVKPTNIYQTLIVNYKQKSLKTIPQQNEYEISNQIRNEKNNLPEKFEKEEEESESASSSFSPDSSSSESDESSEFGSDSEDFEQSNTCPIQQCQYSNDNQVKLTEHLIITHKKYPCRYQECNQHFQYLRKRRKHEVTEHTYEEQSIYALLESDEDNSSYSCNTIGCPRKHDTTFNRHNLLNHLETNHPDRKNICDICLRSYKNISALRRHFKINHIGQSIPCRYRNCNRLLPSRGSRNSHEKIKHGCIHTRKNQ